MSCKLIPHEATKITKKDEREGDYFMESAPFKKARISQEVDIESLVSHGRDDGKKSRSRCSVKTQREGQARGESGMHEGTYHDHHV
jgi:hypothetical protein